MKICSTRGGGGLLAAVAVALGLSLAFGAKAQASPQYAMDCTSCHTMPPTDSGTAKKDPNTGGIPGNHAGHATSAVNSCVVCHDTGVLTYGTSHRNKTIELVDGFGYSRKVGGFLNQTSVPPNPLGTCSTAACHSNGKGVYTATPAWGKIVPFQAPGDCSQCHGVAPATGNHPTTGSKHAAYFGTGVASCAKCHTAHDGEAKPFSHATSAGKRAIEVKFAAGGSFSTVDSKCSNVSCHSNGQGLYVPPTWGATLDCSGCHGVATSGTLSGKHASHVNNAAILGTSYGCVTCHSQTVSDNSTIISTVKHVNGVKDVAVACSTCHTNGKGTAVAVSWTDPALGCNGCHGTSNAFGAPDYANAGKDQPLANSHVKHATSSATCVNCHSTTTTTGLAVIAPNHANGTIDVVQGNGKTFTRAGNSCSAISCHSNGKFTPATAKWGDTLDCAGCHGNTGAVLTGAHATHLNMYGCVSCHNATVTNNTTLVVGGKHMDANLDVAGSTISTFDSGVNKSCATSCHTGAAPQWNVPSTGQCGTCHNVTSPLIATNAHSKHFTAINGPGLSQSVAGCQVCHAYTTEQSSTHVDGIKNLNAGFTTNAGCSTCHKQSSTQWTVAASVTCESCHSTAGGQLSYINKTAPDKTLAATKGHTAQGQVCSACHDSSSAHIGVAGGTKRLFSNYTSATGCNSCHDNTVTVTTPSQQKMKVHRLAGIGSACADCHNPHGTLNNMMVNETVNSTAVSFTGNNTFANGAQNGVCQVCHTTTKYFTKAGVTPQQHVDSTTNCLNCHSHNPSTGLAFIANGACDACHGYPPAPRNIAGVYGVQSNWSSARFEDYSGGGGAHIVDAHLSKTIKPSDGFAPCIKCHADAAASHLRVLPARDHVENVTVKIDQQYRFSNDVMAVYTSAKLVSGGGNVTGKCFNVSCHFTKTKQWSNER